MFDIPRRNGGCRCGVRQAFQHGLPKLDSRKFLLFVVNIGTVRIHTIQRRSQGKVSQFVNLCNNELDVLGRAIDVSHVPAASGTSGCQYVRNHSSKHLPVVLHRTRLDSVLCASNCGGLCMVTHAAVNGHESLVNSTARILPKPPQCLLHSKSLPVIDGLMRGLIALIQRWK